MMDACYVMTYQAAALNRYGKPEPARYESSVNTVACGLGYTQSSSTEHRDEVSTMRTAIRLPLDTLVTAKDRVKVIRRFGSALSQVGTYKVLGAIRRGPSGLTMNVALVTDGSDE